MIVHDLNAIQTAVFPSEIDRLLVVNPDIVLSGEPQKVRILIFFPSMTVAK